ncbi:MULTISPECIES: MFS transporter [unclassified Paenibacillus]|uniref:MFS transporter n=1 Tax=unclassified Paenibacillus TaxID=185978 RepID=UPI0003FF0E82|nr:MULTISPECIES: MFS transporter [unclassified Paenibacillus]KGP83473.1 arabinose ABC transporter permease [Paenibacillus sp. MAEPY2]KGP86230.1 arabinose ABC transporter permease [Paenibacillus sp. MAEPY1]
MKSQQVNPLLILILALGVFAIITTEVGIIGVLPLITQKFNITAAQAGWLVSIFALVVAVSGPFLTLLVSGINRKTILLIAVLLFAISNVVYAYTTRFDMMLIFRIIPAIFHPVFFSVALVTGAKLVPPEKSSQAVAKVFTGITAGFAFGVPLTSYLADRFSLEAAFWFGAAVSIIAFIGIWIWLPSMPVQEKMSYGKQIGILRKPALWLNIAAVIFIFAAMFSVYSYFAEYLGQVTRMDGSWISAMLLAFGVIMIAGNLVFGQLLHRNIPRTVLLFPVLYMAAYLLVFYAGSYFIPMIIMVFVWGAIHSGGLIVSQTWLTTESQEAPEFGNSLFVSFSNLGITLGTSIGGWFIAQLGIHQVIWSGIIFGLLALVCIVVKINFFTSRSRSSIETV